MKEKMNIIKNVLLAVITLIAFLWLFRTTQKLDFLLNVYLGKWYILYCVPIIGGFAFAIYNLMKNKIRLWHIVFLPIVFMGLWLLLRTIAALGGYPSGGGSPFFETIDPARIDFWHYIKTGEIK